MQTIKTAVVVVLLMVILYGAFVAMNGKQTELPPDLENMITMGPDFTLEPPTGGAFEPAASPSTTNTSTGAPAPLATTDASTGAIKASASDAPFAMWPGADASTSSTKTTADVAANAVPADVPELDTANMLLPSASVTTNVSDKSASDLEVPSLELPAPPATTTSTAATSTDMTASKGPWMETLQNSVAGNAKTDAAKPDQSSGITMPTTLASVKNDPPAASADAATTAEATADQGFALTSQSFENAKKLALEQIEKSNLKEGLQTLSVFYNSPELTSEQRADLLDMLDALSFEVIYSRRHLVDPPYIVAPNETLNDIAQIHEISVDLLARINGIEDPNNLMPGTKLKVVRGPFRGEVDIANNEMTMFVGELYAGRFPISTGRDPSPREGVFQVVDKQKDRNYYGPGGIQIDGKDPRNPYGGVWVDLGSQLSIHGSPANPAGDTDVLGCISLSPNDAKDVFIMLGRGSQVTIKR